MPFYDASALSDDVLGWRAQAGARLMDLLERRSIQAGDALSALARRLENAWRTGAPRALLLDLAARMRRSRAQVRPTGAPEDPASALHARILGSCRRDTIEEYAPFLFVADVRL